MFHDLEEVDRDLSDYELVLDIVVYDSVHCYYNLIIGYRNVRVFVVTHGNVRVVVIHANILIY